MSLNRAAFLLTSTVVASLAYLYAGEVWLISTEYLAPLTAVEAIVLLSQLLRVALVFAVPSLRNARPFSVLCLLSLETLSLPVLALLILTTGGTAYRQLGLQVEFGWAASLLLLAPSVAIFRFARSMYAGERLSVFLPSSAFMFGLLGSLQGLARPSPGVAGLPALAGAVLKALTGAASGYAASGSYGLAAATVATFFGVAVYALAGGRGGRTVEVPALLVVLAGILGALGWVAVSSRLTSSALFALTLPTTAVGGMFWWLTRETSG